MITPHHLKYPPIKEAVFDIRVKARQDFLVSDFGQLKTLMHDKFPKVQEQRGGSFNIEFNKSEIKPGNIQDLGLQGFFFKSEDEKLLAQFRIDGFTLNRINQYSNWEELYPLFMELWRHYLDIAKPEAITRIAVRFINHIAIHEKNIDFDDYFTASPRIPSNLPQTISRFFSKCTIVSPEKKISANVIQAFDPKPPNQDIIVIIDIDTYKDIETNPDDTSLALYFSSLREFKNLIFFNFLTEKTIGLFE